MIGESHWSGIRCEQHHWEEITNICLHFKCLKPLCPQCVSIHTKIHDRNDIESWKSCVTKAAAEVKHTLQELKKILNTNILSKSFKSIDVVESENLQQLREMRHRLHKLVDQTFDLHQRSLTALIRAEYKLQYPDGSKLKSAIDQIQNILLKIRSPATAIAALTRCIKLDHISLLQYFQNRKTPLNKNITQTFFGYSQNDLNGIKQSLSKIIVLQKSNSANQQKNRINNDVIGLNSFKDSYHNTPKPLTLSSNQNFDDNRSGLKIFMKDYFSLGCKTKYLHFFVPYTKELNLFALEGAKGRSWQTIQFASQLDLPLHFKSIITPAGEIYLTGGSDSKSKRNDIYKYNFASNTLEQVARMQSKRSSHALCYVDGLIYIIGGLSSKNQPMRDCEAYDIQTRQCLKIASLNIPVANCCAASFNSSMIYSIGVNEGQSLIEVYNNKKWSIVEIGTAMGPKFKLKGHSFSAGVQINESYILVFGGYDAITEAPMNTCFALKVVGQKVQIEYYNEVPLFYSEGFWDNSPIINQGKVFALQNIEDEEDKSGTRAQHRRIIVFDGNKWI